MGPETAILVVACDLLEEAPVWFLRVKQAAERGARLIVVNPRPPNSSATPRMSFIMLMGKKAPCCPLSGRALLKTSPRISVWRLKHSQAENAVILYGSEGIGLAASKALAHACAKLLADTGHTGRPNNGLVGVWHNGNLQGAWDMGFRPVR
jgi:NADH-quinone oxidoreductase subunit G